MEAPRVHETPSSFQPFVPATETRPELTPRALILGCIFGLLFGAVTVYVGLREDEPASQVRRER